MKFRILNLRNKFTYLVKTALWRYQQSLTSSTLYWHCFVASRREMSSLHSSLLALFIPREITLLHPRRLAGWISLLPLLLRFRTLLYLHVNLIKAIRVAITISTSSRFQWESWITWNCNCCLSLYVFYKFLEEPVMVNTQFHQCNPSIIFCRWNDAKRRYPDCIYLKWNSNNLLQCMRSVTYSREIKKKIRWVK